MPDLSWNNSNWGGAYDWKKEGEEWSTAWGGSDAQWFGSIYPRLSRYVHCNSILEIAPGFGRWTRFLVACAEQRYLGVDIAEECIDACTKRFPSDKAEFVVGDGKTLPTSNGEKFDFIFSFDSLVHADRSVMESYVPQIIDALGSRGVAFIHHSNVADLKNGLFRKKMALEQRHYRDDTVSAPVVEALVEQHGGRILIQEVVNWGCEELIDCFSLFAKADAFPELIGKKISNDHFMHEASNIKDYISPYFTIHS